MDSIGKPEPEMVKLNGRSEKRNRTRHTREKRHDAITYLYEITTHKTSKQNKVNLLKCDKMFILHVNINNIDICLFNCYG